MASPYVGEIRMFASSFAPAGWSFCEGQLLSISDFETLFSLIGTTYGGDGQNTFALPDLRGRTPLHVANGYPLGFADGSEEITLAAAQLPTHSHALLASTGPGNQASAENNVIAESSSVQIYAEDVVDSNFSARAVASTGGGHPHTNLQPYLCVSFIISLYGILPTQN